MTRRTFLGFLAAGFAPVVSAPLECGPSIHDAGRVAQGRDLVTEVACRNVSDHPVDLGSLRAECACLSIAPSRTGMLPPGAGVRLRMRLATDGLTDRIGFPVEIGDRPGSSATLLFHYEADVRPSVVAIPEYVDLGDWKKSAAKQIVLVDTTGGSFAIDRAVVERSGVDVVWSQVGLLRVNDRWTVTNSKGAVTGYLVTVHARSGHDGRRSISDEIQIELRHSVQKNVRVRVVGFSP